MNSISMGSVANTIGFKVYTYLYRKKVQIRKKKKKTPKKKKKKYKKKKSPRTQYENKNQLFDDPASVKKNIFLQFINTI
jgi:hypothetical protein